MSEPSTAYVVTTQTADAGREELIPAGIGREELPARLVDYLRERRRALITELRQIEDLLQLQQSIPPRQRPH
jgi:hypothetical protein